MLVDHASHPAGRGCDVSPVAVCGLLSDLICGVVDSLLVCGAVFVCCFDGACGGGAAFFCANRACVAVVACVAMVTACARGAILVVAATGADGGVDPVGVVGAFGVVFADAAIGAGCFPVVSAVSAVFSGGAIGGMRANLISISRRALFADCSGRSAGAAGRVDGAGCATVSLFAVAKVATPKMYFHLGKL